MFLGYNIIMNGFEPIYDKNSKILILGSFPSIFSRKENFYYGNKQNKFWKVFENIFKVHLDSIEDKKNFLLEHNIALWDIIESCEIFGSMDKNIKNYKFVDLKSVLPPNTKVCKVLCNGKKSFELTQLFIKQNNINLPVIYLPSTSPANTYFDIDIWKKEFQITLLKKQDDLY